MRMRVWRGTGLSRKLRRQQQRRANKEKSLKGFKKRLIQYIEPATLLLLFALFCLAGEFWLGFKRRTPFNIENLVSYGVMGLCVGYFALSYWEKSYRYLAAWNLVVGFAGAAIVAWLQAVSWETGLLLSVLGGVIGLSSQLWLKYF